MAQESVANPPPLDDAALDAMVEALARGEEPPSAGQEPQEEQGAAQAQPEQSQEQVEEEEEDEAQRFYNSLPEDERLPFVLRLNELLPEDQRLSPRPSAPMLSEQEQAALQQDLFQSEQLAQQTLADAGNTIAQHLAQVRQALLNEIIGDPPQVDYDYDLINAKINEAATAIARKELAPYRFQWNRALLSRLGDPSKPNWGFSEEDERKIARRVVESGGDVIGAMIDMAMEKAKAEGREEGRQEGRHEEQQKLKAERAALRAQLMREMKLEPELKGGRTGTTPSPEDVSSWSEVELDRAIQNGSIFEVELRNIERAKRQQPTRP